MVEGIAGAAPSCRCGVVSPATRRCCGGGGCGLGRLVRQLRWQGKQTLCAARPATTLRGCQYDPLSYARNFDQSGFGGGGGDADSSDDAEASLYYSHTFSSCFVLAYVVVPSAVRRRRRRSDRPHHGPASRDQPLIS